MAGGDRGLKRERDAPAASGRSTRARRSSPTASSGASSPAEEAEDDPAPARAARAKPKPKPKPKGKVKASSRAVSAAAAAAAAAAGQGGDSEWGEERWTASEAEWARFKKNVPLLYEQLAHTSQAEPCFGAAWGGVIERKRAYLTQVAYYSRATDATPDPADPTGRRWIGRGNFLYSTQVRVPVWNTDPGMMPPFSENSRSTAFSVINRVVHPGQVNNVKAVPSNRDVCLTHTDDPDVYVWNMATQARGRAFKDAITNVPNLILTGHERGPGDCFYYALDVSQGRSRVVSGGSDRAVCVWSLERYLAPPSVWTSRRAPDSYAEVERVAPERRIADAHSSTVEDTRWMPGSDELFVSVGDDRALRMWDMRCGGGPVYEMLRAHDADINAVSWSEGNTALVATGSDDRTAKVFDLRAVSDAHASGSYAGAAAAGPPVVVTLPHRGEVKLVSFRPKSDQHLATCGLAAGAGHGSALIWDLLDCDSTGTPRVRFDHRAHRAPLTVFEWNPEAEWTVMSFADNNAHPSGQVTGGAMQVWRPSRLLCMPDDDGLALARQGSRYARLHASAGIAPRAPPARSPSASPSNSGSESVRSLPPRRASSRAAAQVSK